MRAGVLLRRASSRSRVCVLTSFEAEFELPAFVVERDDLGGGEGHRIEQRGEQCLGAKATPLVANRPDAKSGWKVAGAIADQASGLAAGGEIDELVARPEALDDAAAQRHGAGAGAAEPMALAGGSARAWEQSVGGEFAIEDHPRGIGELGPEVGGKLELAVVVGPERQGRQHMTA